VKLNIPTGDTSKDALLENLISGISGTIAEMCHRTFGAEEVEETFYEISDCDLTQRLYLSRWPVKFADITSIGQNGNDILVDNVLNDGKDAWVLEEETGTLYLRPDLGTWGGTVDVVYTGGYVLPDGAPDALKFAAEALLREGYMSWIRSPGSFGVRLIAHKESRVSYYGPNMFPTLGLPATWTAVGALLQKFTRPWV
jgi:hypothetical protein